MTDLWQAGCPRCGTKPKVANARFCPRCGLERSAPMPPPPPMHPAAPPVMPPPQHFAPPPGYVIVPAQPAMLPRHTPPKKKSGSGCGCLIGLIILGAVIWALASASKPSSSMLPTKSLVSQTAASSYEMPARPGTTMPPLGPVPEIQSLTTISTSRNGRAGYEVTATIVPDSRKRILVVAYPTGSTSWGSPPKPAAEGKWVNIPSSSQSTGTVEVELFVPIANQSVFGSPDPAGVEIVVFDEKKAVLSRQSAAFGKY